MPITPLFDRVLVRRSEAPSTTKSGLFLPSSAAEKPSQGTVLAIGNGKRKEDGSVTPLQVQVNDTVVFSKYAGSEITVDGKELIIFKEEELLGVITAGSSEDKDGDGTIDLF